MTRVATMGVSSCATIALAGWKEGQRELNEAYKKDPKSFKAPTTGMSVKAFCDDIIYPTSQPLGHTHELPFEKLMQDLEKSGLKNKFMIATLNLYQYQGNKNYWPNELNRWGFVLIDKVNNDIGTINYIYVRNTNNKVPIEKDEH
jgi:hypothetical protein